jgi:hypothetical protein
VDRHVVHANRRLEPELLDFAAISELPIEDIAQLLSRAGYARGEYMNQLLGTHNRSSVNSGNTLRLISSIVPVGSVRWWRFVFSNLRCSFDSEPFPF